MSRRAYVKVPTVWLDDRRIAGKNDANWREFVENYARNSVIHYESDAPPERRHFEAMKPTISAGLFDKYNNKCAQCGSSEKLEIDHIIPIARGGSNETTNLQILCRKCNRKKGAKL